jgi:alkylation response protein AidB-like acyl-CoA dehydrogenase
MHLGYTDGQRALRKEIREWLAAHLPSRPLASYDTEEGFEQHRAWERTLHGDRWSCPTWPRALGGRGCDLIDWLIFEEEYWAAGSPGRVNQNGVVALGPVLMEFGSEEQKRRFLPRIASGEDIWAQGWSEPGAGSDMSAIRSTAEREGDGYVLNGRKSWVARAVWADWLFGLFRTEIGSQRHIGLSVMLVPLDAPGVTVQPIRQLNGLTGLADVVFEQVRIPADQRLGAEGAGWHVSNAISGFERGLMLRSPARFQETARALVDLFRQHGGGDAALGDAVVECWMQARAYALTTYRTASRLMKGVPIGADSSANKIYWSELDLRMHEIALRILGDRAELLPGEADAGRADSWLEGFLFAQAGPIYAGTNEIQRNVVAERLLGMPR